MLESGRLVKKGICVDEIYRQSAELVGGCDEYWLMRRVEGSFPYELGTALANTR
jgi:hypothetical protein